MSVAQKTVTGRILLVQEGRFRLIADGRGFLLTLAHDANIEASELCRLHEENARVVVEYEGEPNLESGIARRVTLA